MTTHGHDNGSSDTATLGNFRPLELDWELLALEELLELDWPKAEGNELAPGSGHRRSWDDLILYSDLRGAIERLNPALPRTPSERPSRPPRRPPHRTRTRRTGSRTAT